MKFLNRDSANSVVSIKYIKKKEKRKKREEEEEEEEEKNIPDCVQIMTGQQA